MSHLKIVALKNQKHVSNSAIVIFFCFEGGLLALFSIKNFFPVSNQVLDLKLKALILDTIHHIDVVRTLDSSGVRGAEDWLWQKQLRYYLEGDSVK